MIIFKKTLTYYFSAFLLVTLSFSQIFAAELTGKISGIKGDKFYVEMSTAELPRKGDSVTIILDLDGEGFEAGKAEVIESNMDRVTAKTTEGSPAIDMKVLIKTSGPIEYMLEVSGNEFQYKGTIYWYPGVVIKFKSVNRLKIGKSYSSPLSFHKGGYFSRPEAYPGGGKSLKGAHHERTSSFLLYDHGNEIQVVWRDRKVQADNTVVYVTQAIITEQIKPFSPEEWAKRFPNIKYTKRAPIITRDQKFTISGVIPAPPPDNRIYTEHFWHVDFRIPDDFDEQYRPDYWEKILMEILQTVSVDIS